MALVEAELKEIFEKKRISSFFKAFAYLINAGYSEIDALSNAKYFFPDYEFSIYYKIRLIRERKNDCYRFEILEPKAQAELEHLSDFFEFCIKNRIWSHLPSNKIEINLTSHVIVKFLVERIKKSGKNCEEDEEDEDDCYEAEDGEEYVDVDGPVNHGVNNSFGSYEDLLRQQPTIDDVEDEF